MLKNSKKVLVSGIILVVTGLAMVFLWRSAQEKGTVREKRFSVDDHAFRVELADTVEKREVGLSGRKNLCQDCGMLFAFEREGIYSFWMKDMQLSLDIIWIRQGRVVQIAKNVSYLRGEAEVVRSNVPVDQVLEINAGLADSLRIEEGDSAFFH